VRMQYAGPLWCVNRHLLTNSIHQIVYLYYCAALVAMAAIPFSTMS